VAQWYRLAAEQGHGAAMAELAQLLETGRGVKQDLRAALTLYRQAHGRGHATAGPEALRLQDQLSTMRRSG
jgi:uncharacterized protein